MTIRFPHRISSRLTVAFGLMALVVVFATGLVVFHLARKMLDQAMARRQATIARHLMNSIDQALYGAQQDIRLLADTAHLEAALADIRDGKTPLDLTRVTRELDSSLLLTGPWDLLFIVDREGRVIASTSRSPEEALLPSDPTHKRAIEAALEGLPWYSDKVLPRGAFRPVVVFAAPVRDEEVFHGTITGVIVGHFAWPVIEQILDRSGTSTRAQLFDRNAILLGGARHIRGDDHVHILVEQDGFLSYRGSGWKLQLETQRAEMDQPIVSLARNVLLALGLMLLIVMFAVDTLARRVSAPLIGLTGAVRHVAGGDLDTSIAVTSNDEVGQLGAAFNDGVTRVRDQMAERRRAEEDARAAQDFLRLTIDNIPQIVAVKDVPDFRVVLVNRAAEAQMPPMLGRTNVEIFGPESGMRSSAEDREVVHSRRPLLGRSRPVPTRRGERTFVFSKIPLLDSAGQVRWIVVIAEDVTEKLAREERLHRAELAEAASHAKSEFIARMSHEIRTPMNGVIGMSSLLMETPLGDDQREYAETIQSSAAALLTVINDVLDLSRIEAGRLSLAEAPFSLRETLSESARVIALAAARKSLELVIDVAPEIPDSVAGDAGRLRQMILNLLSNAVKFTSRGEIVIGAGMEAGDGTAARFRISVRDTGPGIAAAEIPRMFEPFEQLDASNSRLHGGSGLGLSITRRLAELMGGSAGVESEPGRGSTFTLTIPLRLLEPERRPDDDLAGRTIAVVDENETARGAIAAMLAWHGADVRTFASWDDALAQTAFEDVIIDAHAGVTAALAGGIDPARVIPLYTASNLPLLAGEFRAAGIARHLVKPVVESRILGALTGGEAPASQPAAARPAKIPRLRILVAEDNLVNQRVAARFLEQDGHHVVIAADGHEAVDAFRRHSFDVVLMDIEMPLMDGFAATNEIRRLESEGGRHTPIVALTAHATPADRERCLAAAMDGYVSKPIDREELRRSLLLATSTTTGVPA